MAIKRFQEEFKRASKFQRMFIGAKEPTHINKELNHKTYVTYVLQDGTIAEKRELLGMLKSRVIITKSVITIQK